MTISELLKTILNYGVPSGLLVYIVVKGMGYVERITKSVENINHELGDIRNKINEKWQ